MKSKRFLQKEQTRQIILQTASHIYAEEGFTATTADIAKAAGVSHGCIFVHFPTLCDLQIAVIEDFGNVLIKQTHELVRTNQSMQQILETHLGILIEHEALYTRLITQRALLPESVGIVLPTIQTAFAHHFRQIWDKERDFQLSNDIPVHMLFNTWMGLIHYYLLNKDLFAPGSSVLERYGQQLIDTFMKLIQSKG